MFANPGSGGNGRDTVDGYKLQTGSPALNSGSAIFNGQDDWGNPVSSSSAPNRGAYNGAGVTASGTGGANLALNQSYQSSSDWDATQSAAMAFDGDLNTDWQSPQVP